MYDIIPYSVSPDSPLGDGLAVSQLDQRAAPLPDAVPSGGERDASGMQRARGSTKPRHDAQSTYYITHTHTHTTSLHSTHAGLQTCRLARFLRTRASACACQCACLRARAFPRRYTGTRECCTRVGGAESSASCARPAVDAGPRHSFRGPASESLPSDVARMRLLERVCRGAPFANSSTHARAVAFEGTGPHSEGRRETEPPLRFVVRGRGNSERTQGPSQHRR